MERIAVIGKAGGGKSTLARALAARHGLPYVEVDALLWRDGWQAAPVDEYEAVKDADALVIVTEWNQFRALDMTRIRDLMKTPRIADLRNIYEPEDLRALGFEYVGVGR